MKIAILLSLGLLVTSVPALADEKMWVTSDRAARHTCPDTKCGVVGVLMFREAASVFEIKDGWARISKPYYAECVNEKSKYVDSGDARCVPGNGIIGGKFAEWVELKLLAKQRPDDPGKNASGYEALVKQSDDFRLHGPAFGKAAEKLIKSGICTEADFREMGGWMKSTNHGNQPVYFTYCGGMRLQNKVYINVKTGETFR